MTTTMMSSRSSGLVVALHQVLHEHGRKDDQVSNLVAFRVIVMIGLVSLLEVVHQLAYVWQFVLRQQLVWLLDPRIESLPCPFDLAGRHLIRHRRYVSRGKSPYEDALGLP